MTIGPEPMIKILRMSVRLGISGQTPRASKMDTNCLGRGIIHNARAEHERGQGNDRLSLRADRFRLAFTERGQDGKDFRHERQQVRQAV